MSSPVSINYSALGERSQPPTIARLMTLMLENPKLLSLAAGFTDNQTLPVPAVQAAVTALAKRAGEPEYLQYGTNQGRPKLRALLADRLLSLETPPDADTVRKNFFVTNGSQQALYLAMQVLCDPGDIVLVDRPSYFVYLEMLVGLGVQARSMPVDADGRIDAAGLSALLETLRTRGELKRVKAVYFVSYFSNPSARSLDESEKNAIADVLTQAGVIVPVVEDAAYRELYYNQPHAARSVLSLPSWAAFPKLYLSTLTKPFASGLKVGYGTSSDSALLAKMLHVKGHHDFGTANYNQALFEQILSEGGLDAQLAVIRPGYQRKMRALHGALTAGGLPALGWSWAVPGGGLYLWLTAPAGLDTGMDSAFCHACVKAGVLYVPGDLCFGDDAPKNFIRLSFGVLNETDLIEAARRFVGVAKQFA
ncbi:PLP-dependent aminotransferase family protein [Rariglobus hedericola]|uniref:PLP-dependent aminotransferase family protein n=1 Tax=Rariglobus hedericola TaxID=2597822 RepID=A0A556QNT7_9BACT|nr:PLP-dependent aminotransferase family protein [Rariglobus hedericola]TSJ78316.1 PLP-dependent aminotransferase family protein [Rariglobus hedericola]